MLIRPAVKIAFVLPLLFRGAMALAQSQDTFTPTGDMTAQRMGHTATLLTNGKVLVTGGYAVPASFPVWASAELYDPLTGKFAPTGSMTTPRAGHTATLLPDGKVLIAGGFVSSALGSPANIVATAELYDPFTSTFTATGSMTAPRQGHTASLLNTGKVLITGGQSSDRTTLQSSAEVYDPLTGAFTSTGGMAAARAWHVATLLPNGRVLIEGGASCDGQPTPELYDPVAGQFSPHRSVDISSPWGLVGRIGKPAAQWQHPHYSQRWVRCLQWRRAIRCCQRGLHFCSRDVC